VDVLSSATDLCWYTPFAKILLNSALEDDDLVNDDWRTQEIKRMIENPEPIKEYLIDFLFLTSDDPAECRCALPPHPYFSNPEALSAARTRMGEFRDRGYCPLHRHLVLVDFVEMLSKLLVGKLEECMKYVDLRRANAAADSSVFVPGDPPKTLLDYKFEKLIVERKFAIDEGREEDDEADDDNEDGSPIYKYTKCKGTIPPRTRSLLRVKIANGIGCRFRHWIQYFCRSMPVAEITGSKDLFPFMMDVAQLEEMHRIRSMTNDQYHYYGEQVFWRNMKTFLWPDASSAKEQQCLRDTMPPERLGPVRYDPATVGQNVLERFKFCRTNLGMNDLPDFGSAYSGV